jgi:hypothetical protein
MQKCFRQTSKMSGNIFDETDIMNKAEVIIGSLENGGLDIVPDDLDEVKLLLDW